MQILKLKKVSTKTQKITCFNARIATVRNSPPKACFESHQNQQLAIGCGADDAAAAGGGGGAASVTDFLDFFLKRFNPFMVVYE